jgi:membrane protein YqaA with SNARE-associated domain
MLVLTYVGLTLRYLIIIKSCYYLVYIYFCLLKVMSIKKLLSIVTAAGVKFRLLLAAFVFGAAEATFFFIVPDVFTSWLVIRQSRSGFLACVYATMGAVIGGSILFWIGKDQELRSIALEACAVLPGIQMPLISHAAAELRENGLGGLFTGVLSGIPYKLFALQVAPLGIRFSDFIIASIAARLMRFIAVTAFTWLVFHVIFVKWSNKVKLCLHGVVWVIFYGFYFCRMGL